MFFYKPFLVLLFYLYGYAGITIIFFYLAENIIILWGGINQKVIPLHCRVAVENFKLFYLFSIT